MEEQKGKYIIESIRKSHTITGYLSSIGVHPQHEYDGKSIYLCPFPGHSETKPSFVVYSKPDGYEDFFCYGCKSNGNIITLYAKINGISWWDTIEKLSDGIDISFEGAQSYAINSLQHKINTENIEEEARDLVGVILLKLSSLGYDHLKRTGFDTDEENFLELYYKEIDKYVSQEDIIGLLNLNDFVNGSNKLNKKLFKLRFEKWNTNKVERKRKEMEGKNL